MIRVLIAASSPLARAGLEASLRAGDDLALVGDPNEADVVLTDIKSPDDDALHELPAVLLVDNPQPPAIADALRTGARAVLSQDSTPAQIVAAIEAVAAGLVVMQPAGAELWTGNSRPAPVSEPLTPREIEVLGMMAEGLPNKAIAHRLGISEHTVKFHATSILSKLNAASRTEAVMLGLRRGLILL